MTIEEIKALFPLKGKLTKTILRTSKISDSQRCNGALTLKKALGEIEGLYVSWGDTETNSTEFKGEIIRIGTEENLDFMEATEPQEVTFLLIQ